MQKFKYLSSSLQFVCLEKLEEKKGVLFHIRVFDKHLNENLLEGHFLDVIAKTFKGWLLRFKILENYGQSALSWIC